jgi:hypothetical protein
LDLHPEEDTGTPSSSQSLISLFSEETPAKKLLTMSGAYLLKKHLSPGLS